MDLLDVMRKRLTEGGITDVFLKLPDGRRHPESVTLAFAAADRKIAYYDLTESAPLRVTVIVKRLGQFEAMTCAQDAERIIRSVNLESENGSYDLESIETTEPVPIPWDEAGRWVWAFDVSITLRKDFF